MPPESRSEQEPALPHVVKHSGVFIAVNFVIGNICGLYLAAGLGSLAGDLQDGRFSWESGGKLAIGLACGTVEMFIYRETGKIGLSRVLIPFEGCDQLEEFSYVLYLRSFRFDQRAHRAGPASGWSLFASLGWHFAWVDPDTVRETGEEQVLHHFLRFGRVVAVGSTRERYPLPGADRTYLPKGGWKPQVSDAISRSRLVAIVAAIDQGQGEAEGTLWEFAEAVRLLSPSRLMLLIGSGPVEYDRFRKAAASYSRNPEEQKLSARQRRVLSHLPRYPPPRFPQRLRKPNQLRGVIRFDDSWRPAFVLFDPTTERGVTERRRWRVTVRRQIDPVMALVERSLPGKALAPPAFPIISELGITAIALVSIFYLDTCIGVRSIAHEHTPLSEKVVLIAVLNLYFVAFIRRMMATAHGMSLRNVKVLPGVDAAEIGNDIPGHHEPGSLDEVTGSQFIARWFICCFVFSTGMELIAKHFTGTPAAWVVGITMLIVSFLCYFQMLGQALARRSESHLPR